MAALREKRKIKLGSDSKRPIEIGKKNRPKNKKTLNKRQRYIEAFTT